MLERGKMDRDLVEFVVIDQLVPKEHLLDFFDRLSQRNIAFLWLLS